MGTWNADKRLAFKKHSENLAHLVCHSSDAHTVLTKQLLIDVIIFSSSTNETIKSLGPITESIGTEAILLARLLDN